MIVSRSFRKRLPTCFLLICGFLLIACPNSASTTVPASASSGAAHAPTSSREELKEKVRALVERHAQKDKRLLDWDMLPPGAQAKSHEDIDIAASAFLARMLQVVDAIHDSQMNHDMHQWVIDEITLMLDHNPQLLTNDPEIHAPLDSERLERIGEILAREDVTREDLEVSAERLRRFSERAHPLVVERLLDYEEVWIHSLDLGRLQGPADVLLAEYDQLAGAFEKGAADRARYEDDRRRLEEQLLTIQLKHAVAASRIAHLLRYQAGVRSLFGGKEVHVGVMSFPEEEEEDLIDEYFQKRWPDEKRLVIDSSPGLFAACVWIDLLRLRCGVDVADRKPPEFGPGPNQVNEEVFAKVTLVPSLLRDQVRSEAALAN